jgi:hypothetical protein
MIVTFHGTSPWHLRLSCKEDGPPRQIKAQPQVHGNRNSCLRNPSPLRHDLDRAPVAETCVCEDLHGVGAGT